MGVLHMLKQNVLQHSPISTFDIFPKKIKDRQSLQKHVISHASNFATSDMYFFKNIQNSPKAKRKLCVNVHRQNPIYPC